MMNGESIRNEILQLLKTQKIAFHHIIHRETIPQNIAQEIRIEMQETIKSLVMREKKSRKNYLICLRGDQKVNMRAFSDLIGETCELEKIETLKERFGLDVGGVCPFGLLMGIADVYFDASINNCSDVVIGCGLPNESIRMKLKDLVSLVHPKIVSVAVVQ